MEASPVLCGVCAFEMTSGDTDCSVGGSGDDRGLGLCDDDDTLTVQCGHTFHTQCIMPWIVQRSACPLCEATLDDAMPPPPRILLPPQPQPTLQRHSNPTPSTMSDTDDSDHELATAVSSAGSQNAASAHAHAHNQYPRVTAVHDVLVSPLVLPPRANAGAVVDLVLPVTLSPTDTDTANTTARRFTISLLDDVYDAYAARVPTACSIVVGEDGMGPTYHLTVTAVQPQPGADAVHGTWFYATGMGWRAVQPTDIAHNEAYRVVLAWCPNNDDDAVVIRALSRCDDGDDMVNLLYAQTAAATVAVPRSTTAYVDSLAPRPRKLRRADSRVGAAPAPAPPVVAAPAPVPEQGPSVELLPGFAIHQPASLDDPVVSKLATLLTNDDDQWTVAYATAAGTEVTLSREEDILQVGVTPRHTHCTQNLMQWTREVEQKLRRLMGLTTFDTAVAVVSAVADAVGAPTTHSGPAHPVVTQSHQPTPQELRQLRLAALTRAASASAS